MLLLGLPVLPAVRPRLIGLAEQDRRQLRADLRQLLKLGFSVYEPYKAYARVLNGFDVEIVEVIVRRSAFILCFCPSIGGNPVWMIVDFTINITGCSFDAYGETWAPPLM